MKNGAGCIHHWWIDSPEFGFRGQDNRFYVKGECQKCSEERLFISEFADVDYVGAGSHQLGSIDIDSDKVSHRYEWRPRETQKLATNTARMTGYELEGCGYDCVDSLRCPYAVCIYDNPRIARIGADVDNDDNLDALTGHQRMTYIRILNKQGLTIEEIIGLTGIPYKKVWTALSTKTYKAKMPEHELKIKELRRQGYSYGKIATMITL